MMMRAIRAAALVLTLGALAAPAPGAEIFGTYNNGCIRGAVPLKAGQGFQLQHWGPGRNYGHPVLIAYVTDLVRRAKQQGLPNLLIGDLSLRYGGPFGAKSSHGSHNIGLDVDISFDFATPRKTQAELNHPKDVYLVDQKNQPLPAFNSARAQLIQLAAADPRVERIFVAPGIKRELCRLYADSDRAWLRTVRPWFGHRGHMHVRLACPADSPYCIRQKPQPEGDGCGEELMSWFRPPEPSSAPVKPKPKPKKVLPEQCALVLQGR